MPSELLSCTICPKKPKFSDVSHLLTHVGSKGHLAHLHRLQVKSHQELNAGHALAIYNQWFQEHGVASLLSDRMRQKEQKRADKKAANEARTLIANANGKSRGRRPTTATQQAPAVSAYEPQPLVLKSRTSDEDFGDVDYTPVPTSRRSNYPVFASSPPKMLPSQSVEDEGDCPAEDDPQVKLSPGTPQLKGTQWPGMDLFDAASEELKKKRNQKKDASVLRGLQRNASRVDPHETVHSAAGAVLKKRHMDDLENDSPVEGEYVIEKPSPRKRKKSGPRAKRQPKEAKRPRGRPRKNLETPSKRPSSFIGDIVRSASRFSPTEDETREYKLAVRSNGRRKKTANFAVYQDSSPPFGVDGSSEVMPPTFTDADTAGPLLNYLLPPWQRQQTEPYDPFKLIRIRFNSHTVSADIGHGKENTPAQHMMVGPETHGTMNPLFSQAGMDRFADEGPFSNQNRLHPVVAPSLDPFNDNDAFMPVRNPLMAALSGLNETPTKQEGFGFDASTTNFATHYRQPLFAP